MANSKTLLVYMLTLVVCGGDNGGFGVNAGTTSILPGKEPLIGVTGTSSSPQQQTRPQHHYTQFYQQQQNSPETSPSPLSQSSSLPSSARSPAPQQLSSPSAASTQQHPQHSVVLHNGNNAPSTMSVKNGFGFSAGGSQAGPYTAGYSYISGRTLNQPTNLYMNEYDLNDRPTPSGFRAGFLSGMQALTPDFGTFFHSGVDLKSVLMGAALGAGASMLSSGGKLSGLFPIVREAVVELRNTSKVPTSAPVPTSSTPAASDPLPDLVSAPNPDEGSSRKRRDAEFDTDLTELATMVLSAIQSGECMQRSICLLGSRIGRSEKGKIGLVLVDKLIPESVQSSQYFVTLKKALRVGESYCDRFRCRFN